MVIDGVTIPDELEWVDEFDWKPIEQTRGFGLTGAMFIQEGEKQTGRTITLSPPNDELGWIDRNTVISLQTSRNTAGNEFTVTLPDARTFTCIWDNASSPLEVEPVIKHNQFDVNGLYRIRSIKLIQVPTP